MNNWIDMDFQRAHFARMHTDQLSSHLRTLASSRKGEVIEALANEAANRLESLEERLKEFERLEDDGK